MTQETLPKWTSRWSGVGPYYAMFPVSFAFDMIREHTSEGDAVLDPFAGRASSVYVANVLNRRATGVEINPVGWLYGRVKMRPAPLGRLEQRIKQIAQSSRIIHQDEINSLPEFFHWCYTPPVLRFLLTAKQQLRWHTHDVDATLMALLLICLHGKTGSALSNQMRQSKAMAPDYSVRWWRERDMTPPDIDPVEFLLSKIRWRYRHGRPQFGDANASVLRGDSTKILGDMRRRRPEIGRYDLLLTSPPYHGITGYFKDQWLRLWMLGEADRPTTDGRGRFGKRFENKPDYEYLLDKVFGECAKLLKPNARIVVRTDARKYTRDVTVETLRRHFPRKDILEHFREAKQDSQTALYGDKGKKPGEYDIIMT